MTVLAATAWRSNAELVAAVVGLGYIGSNDTIADVTYGGGVWWQQWRPPGLVCHDLKTDGVDFRALPEPDDHFDAVIFDPPYVPIGSQETSTLKDYNERYGRDTAPRSPAGIQKLINDGLAEVLRVTRKTPSRTGPGRKRGTGVALVKTADYVWSGRLHLGSHDTITAAVAMGWRVEERLIHVGKAPRPQPGGRSRKCPNCKARPGGCEQCVNGRIATVQEHARQNASMLLVLRAPRLPKPVPRSLGL